MEINPSAKTGGTAGVPGSAAKVPKAKTGTDSVSLQQTDAITQALQQQPAVRAAAVDRARALAVDPQYPPLPVVRAVANLLVPNLDDSSQ
jgi:hypothetical protein